MYQIGGQWSVSPLQSAHPPTAPESGGSGRAYLDEVMMCTLRPPNAENATNSGMIQAITPSVLLANVCRRRREGARSEAEHSHSGERDKRPTVTDTADDAMRQGGKTITGCLQVKCSNIHI